MNPGAPVIVVGRTVANFRKCGHTIPPGTTTQNCGLCGAALVLTREGTQQAQAKAAAEGSRLYVICSPCVAVVEAIRPQGSETDVITTEYAREQMARNPQVARDIADLTTTMATRSKPK